VAGGLTFFVPLEGVIDLEKERKRLSKEIEILVKELQKCGKQLKNPAFVARAPEVEVAKIKSRKEEFETKHKALEITLNSLKNRP
jgi:valyl-tRNA synthetase